MCDGGRFEAAAPVDGSLAPGSRRASSTWLPAALLAVLIAGVYANSLGIGFQFDDWHVLERNPAIRTLASIPRFFVDAQSTTVLPANADLRPILLTSFALNYAVSGTEPWSWHLVNLVLHWLAVLLIFRIVRDHLWLGDERVAVALTAALLVAVHPLNTEPVDYLSARSALLTTVFYLAAFDRGVRDRRSSTVLFFAMAMLTKAIAFTLPLLLFAHRLFGREREGDHARVASFRLIAMLAAVALGGLLYRLWLVPPGALASTHDPSVGSWTYFMTGWSAYLYYLRLFLWPDALVVDRLDYPWARSFWSVQAGGSLLVLVVLGAAAWRFRTRVPALTFAVIWYGVTLAAEQTVFPLAEAVNEHRPYLAMLGLGSAAGIALWQGALAIERWTGRRASATLAVLLAVLVPTLGYATHTRNQVWQSRYALWMDATVKAPANPRAWLNAGQAAMAEGRLVEARALLLEGHRLASCYAYIQMNLSVLEQREGNEAGALAWADEAVRCNPGLALTHFYRATALERLGRDDEALTAYRQTTTLDDRHAEAWLGRGRLEEKRRAWRDAVAAYERASALDPDAVDAGMSAGLVHQYYLDEPARAAELYAAVLAVLPSHYGAHYQLATALLAAGREEEARQAWRDFIPLAEAIGDATSLAGAPAALRQVD